MKKAVLIFFILIHIPLLLHSETPDKPVQLSVLYFSNNSSDNKLSWLEKGLSDMLTTDLSYSENIITVEREELEKVLSEQKMNLSGLTDDSERIEIGRLLKADYLVTGSFIALNNIIRYDFKILNTETGEIHSSGKAEGMLENLFDIEIEIAAAVIENFNLEVPEKLKNRRPPRINAAEIYYRGLTFYDSREYSKAVELYKKAASIDPVYEKPRKGIEDSYRFLKDFKNLRMHRDLNKLLDEAEILRNRLNGKEWYTYTDFIRMNQENTDYEDINKQAEMLGLFRGNTPAECTWNLQVKLFEISMFAVNSFNDIVLDKAVKNEIALLSKSSRAKFKNDPFLPVIIYQELLFLYLSGNYEASIVICEELMLGYPDFRMISAVEDFYSNSLEKIK